MDMTESSTDKKSVRYDNTANKATEHAEPAEGKEPHRLNIPGFLKEEIGLGDVFKHATYTLGIKPCGGCQRRAAALNRWLVFSPLR